MMTKHRKFSAIISNAVLFLILLVGVGAVAQTTSREPTLEERLRFGLQARTPSETAFVEAVVDTVNRGELPVRIVDRTFFYARRRVRTARGDFSQRPIIYFRPVLRLQTDRLGIAIRRTAP